MTHYTYNMWGWVKTCGTIFGWCTCIKCCHFWGWDSSPAKDVVEHLYGCGILRHVAGAPHPTLVSRWDFVWVCTNLGETDGHTMLKQIVIPFGNQTWQWNMSYGGFIIFIAVKIMDLNGGCSIAIFDYWTVLLETQDPGSHVGSDGPLGSVSWTIIEPEDVPAMSTRGYPRVNIRKAMENHHRNSEFSHEKLWFSIVNYVSLPEGICVDLLKQILGQPPKNTPGFSKNQSPSIVVSCFADTDPPAPCIWGITREHWWMLTCRIEGICDISWNVFKRYPLVMTNKAMV